MEDSLLRARPGRGENGKKSNLKITTYRLTIFPAILKLLLLSTSVFFLLAPISYKHIRVSCAAIIPVAAKNDLFAVG
jgi:hypothetical protein